MVDGKVTKSGKQRLGGVKILDIRIVKTLKGDLRVKLRLPEAGRPGKYKKISAMRPASDLPEIIAGAKMMSGDALFGEPFTFPEAPKEGEDAKS